MSRLPAAAVLAVASVFIFAPSRAAAAVSCDRSATPSTFASQVSAATAGQTICLAGGSYGTWSGTAKAITITPESGATPTMKVSFASGDSGFTLDGLSGMAGTISAGARDITISHSSFTGQLDVEGATANVVLDGDHFDWNAVSTSGGVNSKLFVDTSGTLAAPALTVRNSTFLNGDLDGIHIGGGSGTLILGNEFGNLCDRDVNHTDNIQFEGGTQIRIAGNYIHAAQGCATQGITSYDGGTNGVIVEDNVVDVPRDWGIEFYADKNSIIRHNTVVYHPKSYSEFNTGTGQIDINRKSADPAGSGTQVYDNLALDVSFNNGSTGTQYNNVNDTTAGYVGPTTVYPGFKLSAGSPVGLNAASDGLDAGARVSGSSTSPTPTPSPSPSPSPTPTPTPTPDTPAHAVWTAPSGVTAGTPVVLDGSASTGDGPLSCVWSFENVDGSTIWETISGCKIIKTFQVADTKYVRLIVTDADGDTDSNEQSFAVASAAPAPTPTPTPSPTPSPTPTPTPSPTPVPAGGLVASYGFDEASGTTVLDASGLANTGTIHGATRTTAGKHGSALSFDGTDYVSVADSSSLELSTGMTLEAWLRPSVSDTKLRTAFAKQSSVGVDYGLYASDASGKVSGRVRTQSLYSGTAAALPAGKWSHLAATYDGTQLRIYVNGALASSKAVAGLITSGTGQLRIGAGFKGVIDDVRVWSTALSASAVSTDATVNSSATVLKSAKKAHRVHHRRRGHKARARR